MLQHFSFLRVVHASVNLCACGHASAAVIVLKHPIMMVDIAGTASATIDCDQPSSEVIIGRVHVMSADRIVTLDHQHIMLSVKLDSASFIVDAVIDPGFIGVFPEPACCGNLPVDK